MSTLYIISLHTCILFKMWTRQVMFITVGGYGCAWARPGAEGIVLASPAWAAVTQESAVEF